MIYYLNGPVTVLEPGLAVVECGGVGYGCRIAAFTAAQLKLNQTARLEMIYEDMRQLLEVCKPDCVAIEELFFGQNVTTGIGVAQSRGVILLAIRQSGLPVYPYKPMQVKQSVVGYGNATKHQVQDMTRRILRLEKMPKPDDAADAIAIALCHARSSTSLLSQIQPK